MTWDTSDRRARLPKDWVARVARVKARAKGRCEDTHHAADCDGRAVEIDHIVQGDDHSLTNLQALSVACHARKTRLDNGYQASVKAPLEQHPGKIR
jgi:5-methylcytosine-specific restriction protein A